MPHRTIRKSAKLEWKWVQPRIARREYELRASGERLAVLRRAKIFGSLAEADTADGRWTLKRQGFLRPRVSVRRAGSEDEYATLVLSWLGDGALHMSDGRAFAWKRGFWSRQYSLTTEQGEELIVLKPALAFVKVGAKVTIHPSAAGISGLSLLVVIGWYVMLLEFDEAGSAAACAVS